MRTTLVLPLLAGVLASVALAQDVPGSQDHPVITRYPGSVIRWYKVDNHRPYRVPTGPVTGYRRVEEGIDAAGKVTRIYYTLDGGARSESEVYKNYRDALASGGFEILAEGLEAARARGAGVGSRQWREVLFLGNPWNDTSAAVNEMTRGSATSGGGGSIVARKSLAGGAAYVIASIYRFREDRIGILVDIVEEAAAETGLIVATAEAIGAGIRDAGRVVLEGILFDFDKATLKPESKAALDQIAEYLKAHPDKRFYVVGHTDSKGTLAYNQKLSSERARAVVTALTGTYGIAAGRLDGHGVGPLSPVSANSSDAAREKNRRVELVEQ